MKKQAYIAPTMMVFQIELHNMIAASDPKVYSNPTDGISDEGQVLSRGFSFDEDDEEY